MLAAIVSRVAIEAVTTANGKQMRLVLADEPRPRLAVPPVANPLEKLPIGRATAGRNGRHRCRLRDAIPPLGQQPFTWAASSEFMLLRITVAEQLNSALGPPTYPNPQDLAPASTRSARFAACGAVSVGTILSAQHSLHNIRRSEGDTHRRVFVIVLPGACFLLNPWNGPTILETVVLDQITNELATNLSDSHRRARAVSDANGDAGSGGIPPAGIQPETA